MKKTLLLTLSLLVASSSASSVIAGDYDREIKARQSVMQLYAYNLGGLGAMAKGQKDYDAGLAQALADNLLTLATMNNGSMWPQGSDMDSAGNEGLTKAKADNWTNYPEASGKHKDLVAAATQMAAEAGNGLDAIRANIGAVGKSCGSCHEGFRAPKD